MLFTLFQLESDVSNGPIDLSKNPIHLDSIASATPTASVLENFGYDGPAFEAYIDAHCTSDAPGRLIMVETTPESWPTWERHTQGDEIVIVLEGEGDFIQQIDGTEQRIPVKPGTTLVNPSSVWHSADVISPIKAVYITPCPGTEHKPRD